METSTAPTQDYFWLAHYPATISWQAELKARPLYSLLEEGAERFGTLPAIDFMNRRWSYATLWQKVRSLAAGFQARGIGKGVQVGLFMPNCPQFVISYYAVLLAGGTVVNFNPLLSPREIAHQVEDSQIRFMVTLSLRKLVDMVEPCLGTGKLEALIISGLEEALPFPKNWLFPWVKRKEIARIAWGGRYIRWKELFVNPLLLKVPATVPERDVAVLQYTGGTTGTPKGVMLTHANLYLNAVQSGLWFDGLQEGREVILGVLPLFHVFSMTVVMNLSLHKGACMLLHPRVDIPALLRDIEAKKISLIPAVPTLYAAMANHKEVGKYNLSSVQRCISGGAPLPLEVKKRFEEVTGCVMIEGYGLTESSPVVAANPLFGRQKEGTIGLPFPQTVLEIVSMEDGETLLPPGEVGELCIRGPQVMAGYWNRPEETAKVLKNGRLHTGDIAMMDEEGYFRIVDRLKDMVIMGGYNVYPRQVEDALYTHPAVKEAAVIGVEHPTRGQQVKAVVALKEGQQVSSAELRAYLRDYVSGYAVPAVVEFVEALPKTPIGKIDKKQLR
jgi:long-chain acyl-CoA synthetase